jgi:cellulose synthase/poly-beta-1,6-N-acetylglucosamine synthase-like glycosyltransferase
MYAVQDDHPARVRVAEATGGSKAADLNATWEHVETPYVLILDADETVDPAFVTRALGILTAQPDIGIDRQVGVGLVDRGRHHRRVVSVVFV